MVVFLVIGICLLINAFLSAFEMAFVSVPKAELRSLSRAGNMKAKSLLVLRDNPERTLSVIQIGITLVGAIAAAVGGAGASDNLEPYLASKYAIKESTAEVLSVILVVLPITYLSVVIGELVPKTLALKNSTRIALFGTNWIIIADKTFYPIVHLFEFSTKILVKFFFKKNKAITASDPTTIEIGLYSPAHQKFIINMAQIEQKKIKDILLPWSQVLYVKKSNTVEEVNQEVLCSGHTRMPVLDDERVVGILHTKESLALKDSGFQNWHPIIREAISVLSTESALKTMRLLQEKRSHMAIVQSPNNEIMGIVTLEDILEEIIGDIADEDDDGIVRRAFASRAKARQIKEKNKA